MNATGRSQEQMLNSTYIHVPGIGYSTERKIWEMGALTWAQYIELHAELKLAEAKKALILPRIEESIERLDAGDHAYFAKVLPSKDHWRAVSEFGDGVGYLDIETTGCNWNDHITVIGLYDGCEMQFFIHGQNLDDFPAVISKYKMLVTFFGSGFDLPFIRRTFPGLALDGLHVDLCHLLRRLGHTGGLKHIEIELGINRGAETLGLGGMDAVRLWHEYRRGSEEALELLLMYNKEDVVNMKDLLYYGCVEMAKTMPIFLQP